jgi:2-polyprenyl-6-hydroxyphenyl methylase / 3-demethylubiquinone-9 3-methyltransferase
MTDSADRPRPRSVDQGQLEHFDALAAEWWTPTKGFRQLNRESTLRQDYVRRVVLDALPVPGGSPDRPLAGLRVADIGCGGGYVSEPLARWGAAVVGVDVAPGNIEAARRHAAETGLHIDYRVAAAEDLEETFDVVVTLEVAEHVADVPVFLRACAAAVRPGGVLVVSTINRTVRSALTVVLAAEHLLRWIPIGTHHYSMFVKPGEVDAVAREFDLALISKTGCKFDIRTKSWKYITSDAGNYIRAYQRR